MSGAPPVAAESAGKTVVRVSCGERSIEWQVDTVRSLSGLVSKMYDREWGVDGERPWTIPTMDVCTVVDLGDGRELRRYRVTPQKWIWRHDAIAPGSGMITGPTLTVEVTQ